MRSLCRRTVALYKTTLTVVAKNMFQDAYCGESMCLDCTRPQEVCCGREQVCKEHASVGQLVPSPLSTIDDNMFM